MKIAERILIIVFISGAMILGCSSSHPNVEPNVQESPQYIPTDKVVIKDCGNSPCVIKTKDKVEQVSILNPQTQTFQTRFYTTSSRTWGFGGGVVYLSSGNYLKVDSREMKTIIEEGRLVSRKEEIVDSFIIQNITSEYYGEYRSWWWYSFMFDLLIVVGTPLGIIIFLGFVSIVASGAGNFAGSLTELTIKELHDYLQTPEGQRWKKKLDKAFQKRMESELKAWSEGRRKDDDPWGLK